MLVTMSVPLNQSSPGVYQIAPAVAGYDYAVMRFIIFLTAAGTWKFTDASGDLTGPISVLKDALPIIYASDVPLVTNHSGEPLNLVTTGGVARGVVVYMKSGPDV